MRAIGTQDKYLRNQNSCDTFPELKTLYVPHHCPAIYIVSDLYLKANKSFVRDLSEIGYLQPTAEMIRELKRELNNNNMDLTKLYGSKKETNKLVTVKSKKTGFYFTN